MKLARKDFTMDNLSGFEGLLREWILEEGMKPESLSEMEQTIRESMKELGHVFLKLWLEFLSRSYTASEWDCPQCAEKAKYERHREASIRSMFGKVSYQRAVYVCGKCGNRHYPMDENLGLRPNEMSAELERLVAQVGVQMPFAQASALFEELTLVSVSDQSIDKATQAYGEEVAVYEQELHQSACDEADEIAIIPLRLYGGRVQTRAAKGEAQPWRELKVGAWYQARGEAPKSPDGEWRIQAYDIGYYADICPAEDFGEIFWATGVARAAEHATELIMIGDGARWIWDLVDLHFPDAIQIIDWFHAREYLMPVAKQAFNNKSQQIQWEAEMRDALWQGQLDTVIATCQSLVHPDLPPEDDLAQRAVTYYTNNRHRMNYPRYRAQGYQIGSGTIESAVKQIASQRLKVSGARWNVDSARSVAKARATFLSQQWHFFAQRREMARRSA